MRAFAAWRSVGLSPFQYKARCAAQRLGRALSCRAGLEPHRHRGSRGWCTCAQRSPPVTLPAPVSPSSSEIRSFQKLRIAVLVSGGVDSSVALALLKRAGHDVSAFYLQIWFQEDFRNFWDACPWEEDLDYLQKVCTQLDVPLTTVPLTKVYWDRVVSSCVADMQLGLTPNPDILCNSRVKFGAFFEFLDSLEGSERFDRVATGHYAGVCRPAIDGSTDPTGVGPLEGRARSTDVKQRCRAIMTMAPDAVKDQTYFLAGLSQRQLRRLEFPLGAYTKREVRALARELDLPNQQRKDSQGLCFLGKVKFNEFIKEHLGEWPGPLVEEETGRVLAAHNGFWFHTIGQRSGMDVGMAPNGPWYVVRKNALFNTVYVSRDYYSREKVRDSFCCAAINWISGHPPVRPLSCTDERAALQVKVRHGPGMHTCKEFVLSEGGGEAFVRLDGNDQGLAPGQYAVFYQGDVCLGGGVITSGGSSFT